MIYKNLVRGWSGKTVLITGGSSGIGLEIALGIHGHASSIVLIANDLNKLDQAKDRIQALNQSSNIYI